MALTDAQKTSFVYKKAVAQVAETALPRDFFNESISARDIVLPSQVWQQADQIPATAPALANGATSGVIRFFEKRTMTAVSGAASAYYLSDLVDCIPYGFDATYNPKLYQSNGTTEIPFGTNDWILNYSGGTVFFYAGNPANVSAAQLPRVSFYKYVGTKGVGSGSGVGIGSSGSINTTGIITAQSFVGDGSGLTGITAVGSGVVVQEEGSTVGTAATINFVGAGATATFSNGVATIAISGASAGLALTVSTRIAGINSSDAVSNVKAIRFAKAPFSVTDLGNGEILINSESSFNPIQINGNTGVTATGEEPLNLIAGTGVTITANNSSTPKSITISATGGGGSSGVSIRDDTAPLGIATIIDFGANLSVSAPSSGIVTVTGSAGGGGSGIGTQWITTATGVTTTSNVGIGTTNALFKIDVNGDVRVRSQNKMRFGGTAGTTNFYIQYNSTANSLDFVAG
jgi:hypothetical protein